MHWFYSFVFCVFLKWFSSSFSFFWPVSNCFAEISKQLRSPKSAHSLYYTLRRTRKSSSQDVNQTLKILFGLYLGLHKCQIFLKCKEPWWKKLFMYTWMLSLLLCLIFASDIFRSMCDFWDLNTYLWICTTVSRLKSSNTNDETSQYLIISSPRFMPHGYRKTFLVVTRLLWNSLSSSLNQQIDFRFAH